MGVVGMEVGGNVADSAAVGVGAAGAGAEEGGSGGGVDAITLFSRCTGFGTKPEDISKLVVDEVDGGFVGVDSVGVEETAAFWLPLFEPCKIGEPNARDMARSVVEGPGTRLWRERGLACYSHGEGGGR